MGLRVAAIETDIEQLWVEGESSGEAAFHLGSFVMTHKCLSPECTSVLTSKRSRTWLCVCGFFGT